MPSPSAPIGSQPTGDPPPSGGAGEPHFPRNLSPGQNPSRSHSVHFSNSPSPTSSPAPRRTTQSSNDSKSRANQSPTAESSADEITPIVGRERGNGKGRRYDGASPEAGEEVHGANAEGSKRSSASSLTAKRRRKKGGVSRQGENEGIDSPDGREDEGEGIMGRISAWAKNVADKYGSVELDNKGSVARDHLALGNPPSFQSTCSLPLIPWTFSLTKLTSSRYRTYIFGLASHIARLRLDRHCRDPAFPAQFIDQ